MALQDYNDDDGYTDDPLPPHIRKALRQAGIFAIDGFRYMAGAPTYRAFNSRSISHLVRDNLEAALDIVFKGIEGASTSMVRNTFVLDMSDANGKRTRWILRLAESPQTWVSIPKSVSGMSLNVHVQQQQLLPIPGILELLEPRVVQVCLYITDRLTHYPVEFAINQQDGKAVLPLASVSIEPRIIEYPEEEDESEEIVFNLASDDNVITIDLDGDDDIEVTGTSDDDRDGTDASDNDMEANDKGIG